MEVEYRKVGDYYLPNLSMPKSKYKNVKLSKYGRAKLKYLKENCRAKYLILKMENKLIDEIYEADLRAQKLEKEIIKKMKKELNVTEELKEKDQLKWVGLMNNIKNSAVENIMKNIMEFD